MRLISNESVIWRADSPPHFGPAVPEVDDRVGIDFPGIINSR